MSEHTPEHTPLPWVVGVTFSDDLPVFILMDTDGQEKDEARANRDFISLAVHNHDGLLAACQGALAALTQNKTYPADMNLAVKYLKAAIADAEKAKERHVFDT